MKTIEQIAIELLRVALQQDAAKQHVGTVTGADIVRLVEAIDLIMSCPLCGAEPWVNIDCGVCLAVSASGKAEAGGTATELRKGAGK